MVILVFHAVMWGVRVVFADMSCHAGRANPLTTRGFETVSVTKLESLAISQLSATALAVDVAGEVARVDAGFAHWALSSGSR